MYAAFMDLEKAYDRVNKEALWSVLRIYGVGGQLLKGIQAFYREDNSCVRVGGVDKKMVQWSGHVSYVCFGIHRVDRVGEYYARI